MSCCGVCLPRLPCLLAGRRFPAPCESGYDFVVHGTYLSYLRHFTVWDYSLFNIANLVADHGIHATLCPLGYAPELVFPAAEVNTAFADVVSEGTVVTTKVDALFYGEAVEGDFGGPGSRYSKSCVCEPGPRLPTLFDFG